MSQFTEEQLKELETLFGLKRREDILPVRDGVVSQDTMVWWRGNIGPKLVNANSGTHWNNIKEFPHLYQLAKPHTKLEYVD
jgi:hypothetical protein